MHIIKPSVLCLFATLGSSAYAFHPAGVQLSITQFTGKQCVGALESTRTVVSGDCITYRIELKNIDKVSSNLEVSAMIPEHTELYSEFRQVSARASLESVVEKNNDGQRVIKTIVDAQQADGVDAVVLEYSVRVI